MILDALETRDDYADIVERIISIAAGWERFETLTRRNTLAEL